MKKKQFKAESKKLLNLMVNSIYTNKDIFLRELISELPHKIDYVIVNEAGASVYSASPLGTKEFPDYDVALRSAVSLARRLQDPLAELVKIDPKAIGVGQYQHDVSQSKLADSLDFVVIASRRKLIDYIISF